MASTVSVAAVEEPKDLRVDADSPITSEGEDDIGSVSTGEGDAKSAHAAKEEASEGFVEGEEEEMDWDIALQPRNLFKLVTVEDKFHVHKILGVISLTHYIYRFVNFVLTGSMGFEHHPTWKVLLFFGIHALLSWSSLIFHLPMRKNRMKPMIWPELRLHNIVFATRSILDAVINVVFTDLYVRRGLCFAAVLAAMLAADLVSDHFRRLELITKQDSTMRSMPWPKDASQSMIAKVNTYYALSQLFATAGVINISNLRWFTDVELALTTLFAVQLSALLMTLVRKSILGAYAWHFWYQISLGLSWVLLLYRYSEKSPFHFVLMRTIIGCMLGYYVRFHNNFNKYVMWSVFAFADCFFLDAVRFLDLDNVRKSVMELSFVREYL